MNRFVASLCVVAVLCGCAYASKIVDASGKACEVVLQVAEPQAAPFCALASEVTEAIIELSKAKGAKPGAKPSLEQIKAKVLEMRAKKAAAKK